MKKTREVEYYKTKPNYYYKKGPKKTKRISKEEYNEASKGKPLSRKKVIKRYGKKKRSKR